MNTQATVDQISIMTMNLRFGLAKDGDNGWDRRRELVRRLLGRYPVDLICFQEVNHFQAAFLKETLSGYGHIGHYNREVPWWQSNMIFYREDWTCLGSRHHFLSHTPDIPSKLDGSKWPRQCVVGWFEKQGQQILAANTHFDFDAGVQAESAGLVMAFIDTFPPGLPALVCGDFNAEPDSPAADRFSAGGFHEVFSGEEITTFHEFKGGRNGPHIDWILYRGGLEKQGARVLDDDFSGRFPSDHYPVQARFTLEARAR
ncbi:MAG: endonuclease/exonuclease/phosphatase family protein [Desulfobacter sp.]|nr:MAG: endonuclease/exonuclease/phosphatase family protein [Desulfobacter sp.]